MVTALSSLSTAITMSTQKVPGWGAVRPQETRAGPNGRKEFLICPEGHDAPFWADLQEVHRHRGRIIYEEIPSDQHAV